MDFVLITVAPFVRLWVIFSCFPINVCQMQQNVWLEGEDEPTMGMCALDGVCSEHL
jgi:hypothetical protein